MRVNDVFFDIKHGIKQGGSRENDGIIVNQFDFFVFEMQNFKQDKT